jgi:DNA-binding MarR family transcriptional regulator
MNDQIKENIETMAEEIRFQARDLKVDTFLSFIHTANIIDKFLDIELSDQPVTRAGFNILHNLILHDGSMMPTEISREVWRSKHSVTKAIDTLEKQGFVKRVSIDSDRRVRRVNITRKGVSLVKKATTSSRERISQKLFRGLDETKLAEFNLVLKQIRKDTLVLINGRP